MYVYILQKFKIETKQNVRRKEKIINQIISILKGNTMVLKPMVREISYFINGSKLVFMRSILFVAKTEYLVFYQEY